MDEDERWGEKVGMFSTGITTCGPDDFLQLLNGMHKGITTAVGVLAFTRVLVSCYII